MNPDTCSIMASFMDIDDLVCFAQVSSECLEGTIIFCRRAKVLHHGNVIIADRFTGNVICVDMILSYAGGHMYVNTQHGLIYNGVGVRMGLYLDNHDGLLVAGTPSDITIKSNWGTMYPVDNPDDISGDDEIIAWDIGWGIVMACCSFTANHVLYYIRTSRRILDR